MITPKSPVTHRFHINWTLESSWKAEDRDYTRQIWGRQIVFSLIMLLFNYPLSLQTWSHFTGVKLVVICIRFPWSGRQIQKKHSCHNIKWDSFSALSCSVTVADPRSARTRTREQRALLAGQRRCSGAHGCRLQCCEAPSRYHWKQEWVLMSGSQTSSFKLWIEGFYWVVESAVEEHLILIPYIRLDFNWLFMRHKLGIDLQSIRPLDVHMWCT